MALRLGLLFGLAALTAAPAFADCPNGQPPSTTICSYNATNDVITCTLTATGDNIASTVTAVYDPTNVACAQEYCVWGTDGDTGAAFCFEHNISTGPVTGLDMLGGSFNDWIRFWDVVTALRMEATGAVNLTVRAFGYAGLDDILGSTYGANDYTELFWGGDGGDTLDGDEGHDVLYGEGDGDTLYGGDGDDELHGGSGVDTLYGDDGGGHLFRRQRQRHHLRRHGTRPDLRRRRQRHHRRRVGQRHHPRRGGQRHHHRQRRERHRVRRSGLGLHPWRGRAG